MSRDYFSGGVVELYRRGDKWAERGPEWCPNGHKLGPNRLLVGSQVCSCQVQNTVSCDDIAPSCSGDQLTDEQAAVIDAVVDAFRDTRSWSIVDVVHDEEPWIKAIESCLRGEDDKISDEEIKSFYARLSATPPSERGRSRVPRVAYPRVTYMSPDDLAAIDDDDDISGFVSAITAARKRG